MAYLTILGKWRLFFTALCDTTAVGLPEHTARNSGSRLDSLTRRVSYDDPLLATTTRGEAIRSPIERTIHTQSFHTQSRSNYYRKARTIPDGHLHMFRVFDSMHSWIKFISMCGLLVWFGLKQICPLPATNSIIENGHKHDKCEFVV